MEEIIVRIASESDRLQRDIEDLPLLPKHFGDHGYDPIAVSALIGVPTAWEARSSMSYNESSDSTSMIDKLLVEFSEVVEAASLASLNPEKMPHVEDKLVDLAAVCVRMLAGIKKR